MRRGLLAATAIVADPATRAEVAMALSRAPKIAPQKKIVKLN